MITVKHIYLALFISLLMIFPGFSVFAQEIPSFDEESLFSGEEMIEETPETTSEIPTSVFTKFETVRIGGYFTGSVSAENTWYDPWNDGFDPLKADKSQQTVLLSGLLFFDARPDEDFRVYFSVKTAWPFEKPEAVSGDSDIGDTETVDIPDIRIFECFSDWSWKERIFFRFGKSTIKWGVGYYWSPADVINLSAIDIMDPEAQREGPVSFRLNIPFFGTQNNIYAYAIYDNETMNAADTAIAAKAEVLLGNYEFGIGGFYKRNKPERGMLTVTGPFFDIDLFAEASFSHGSDKQFITSIPSLLPSDIEFTSYNDRFFVSATAGGNYINDNLKLNMMAQYFYNGEGYSDTDRKARIDEALALPFPESTINTFLLPLILNSGQHYAALGISRSELFFKDFSGTIFIMGNLSDLSAFTQISFNWFINSRMSMDLNASFAFGKEYSEYLLLNNGPAVILGIGFSLGSGQF